MHCGAIRAQELPGLKSLLLRVSLFSLGATFDTRLSSPCIISL